MRDCIMIILTTIERKRLSLDILSFKLIFFKFMTYIYKQFYNYSIYNVAYIFTGVILFWKYVLTSLAQITNLCKSLLGKKYAYRKSRICTNLKNGLFEHVDFCVALDKEKTLKRCFKYYFKHLFTLFQLLVSIFDEISYFLTHSPIFLAAHRLTIFAGLQYTKPFFQPNS